MGIHTNIVPLLVDIAGRSSFSGTICTLGIQDLPEGTDQSAFFRGLGFSRVETLDLPGIDGADHAFDLNESELPPHLVGRFEVVLNGGTLEHVFHVPSALTSITRMLRAGGYAIHLLPCNGWVDHGFYQISPTLMFDYYVAAKFQVLESAMCSFELNDPERWMIRSIAPGELGDGLAGSLDSGVHLYLFVAQRGEAVIERPRPLQSLYARSAAPPRPRWFLPYFVKHGKVNEPPLGTKIDISQFRHEAGHCWIAELPELADVSDTTVLPARSSLILLDDGKPLGPPHSAHTIIREAGHGAFSHWGEMLYFSTYDNSDPSLNGRKYAVCAPGLGEQLR
jgi:hypothetical protein